MRKITNIEKVADDIINIAIERGLIGIDKNTGEPFACFDGDCWNCIGGGYGECEGKIKEWLNTEYFDIDAWINEYYKKANEDKNVKILLYDDKRTIIICDSKGKTGRAVKYIGDEFIYRKGVAIAYARYKGVKIPNEILGKEQ